MHAHLKITLAAAAIAVAAPVTGVANAHGGKGNGPGKEASSRCDRGQGYVARGTLADGSTLTQVAGADTERRGDDRFSGTVIVDVTTSKQRGRGARRGRAARSTDSGLTSYELVGVRALGTVTGSEPLPAVGVRVTLVGAVPKAGCVARPEPTPTPAADDTATKLTTTDPATDDPTDPDSPTDSPATASAAVIRLVTFGRGLDAGNPGDGQRGDCGRRRGDDQGGDCGKHRGDDQGDGRSDDQRGERGGADDSDRSDAPDDSGDDRGRGRGDDSSDDSSDD
ncbi:MAG: hypothetical protein PGN13_14485 [Patulibacter minatonensis]